MITALHSLDREDSLDHSSLADVADVNCGSEARHDLCWMKEDADIGLEILTRHWLIALGTDGHHSSPQLGQRNVQSQGRTLLSSHQSARSFVSPDTGHLKQKLLLSIPQLFAYFLDNFLEIF